MLYTTFYFLLLVWLFSCWGCENFLCENLDKQNEKQKKPCATSCMMHRLTATVKVMTTHHQILHTFTSNLLALLWAYLQCMHASHDSCVGGSRFPGIPPAMALHATPTCTRRSTRIVVCVDQLQKTFGKKQTFCNSVTLWISHTNECCLYL